ncbi:MAG: MoaD/ThiS family protein [Actinomycetes bacterium]|jgi:sulfur-carrier protein|nr:MoaD/ThiS family protein [Candidatus Nanopelagicales bacterium]MDP4825840.1 MoaD/ThiS family protein [Candidatus Nanopelagicales bacterium]MDP4887780.1 MoaD/ThiS family protein [Candidatus Nanopelagicales bacterium]
MSVEVRIPTILRPYTDGAKIVEAQGDSLAAVITDLDTRYTGIGERLVEEGSLRRFINVYLNDEDVRFLGGIDTPVADGDSVTILPAVAGG